MPPRPTLLPRKLSLTLGIGFAMALSLIIVISLLGLQQIAANNAHLETIVREKNLKSRMGNQMRDILRDRAISMLSIAVLNDPFEKDLEMQRFYGFGSEYQRVRLQLEPMLKMDAEKAVLARIDRLTGRNQPIMVRTVDLAMEGNTFLALELLQNEGIPLQRELVRELDNLIAIQRSMIQEAANAASQDYLRTRWMMLVLGLLAAFTVALVAITVVRRTLRLAAASERERTKYRTLFETNTDGIVILDHNGFTDCNPATLKMFRMRQIDDFLKHRPEDLGIQNQPCGTPNHVLAERNIHEAVRTGHAFFEWVAQRPDGTQFPSVIALHAMNLDGKPVIQAIIRDVSAQKEAETTLKTARDAALAATEMKSRFVANVSHEIRTPMNGILGMTGLLMGSALTPRQREYAESINRSAEALMRVINDLLDFSKIEAGRVSLDITAFDLHALIQDVLTLYIPRADAKGLSLRLERHADLPTWVRGDALRLRQILLNLLDNAIKFTRAGEIRLSAGPTDPADTLLFSVSDTGIGLSPEEQGRIFNAFAQADGSVTRQFGGTGLGLTICRQLAELMCGSLELESVKGQGSVFRLRLPLPATQPSHAAHDAAIARQHFPGTRVLVAEDNPVNQKLLSFMLQNLSVDILLAGDGKLAFDLLASESVDLVLMDCQMPEWDGLTATRAIRAREAESGRARVPIIALSANAMQGFAETCTQAGMDGYLSKPLREEQLVETLARWLPLRDAARETARGASESRADMAGDDQPRFDLDKLSRICRDNHAQIAEMLRLFVSSTEALLGELTQALRNRQAARAGRLAHQIKGAAAYLGATAVSELARDMETAARSEDWTQGLVTLEDLEAAFISLRLQIDLYLSNTSPP